ncbi:hypothetical protein [Desulfatitalea tepidiphila]|jgi:hypothetical protein|uniref:hypothetical protein n=1 Tax=Desulfatitalea tepidiphila TaxID=1185843 RepID=UPI0006B4C001|nr:hypothetical protein [Desulfatitalea tepidiphila]
MAKKKGKSVSFDAMVKFFMSTYNIPTKRDVEALMVRLDRIERSIATLNAEKGRRNGDSKSAGSQAVATASDLVLEVIKRYPDGVDYAEIKRQTAYGEKKLRNILFRLHKLGKIRRVSRGVYAQA